jgi:hypothetical protein
MAERDDRMAQDARNAQRGQKAGQEQNEDQVEPTDTLTDRNLSGASTWATLDEADNDSQRADKDRSPKE